MRKITAAAICAVLIFAFSIQAFAAGETAETGADLPSWSETEELSAEFYQKTEPASAAAIVNADSFVDKTADQTNFDVPCKGALLMDEITGQVLYAKNGDEQMPIASITKVMTMLMVFEALESGKIKLQDTVPVTEHAFSMGGSQIWLEPGEVFTVDELLKAVAVSSANDAAVALAEFVGGSESVFCDMMNRRAEELGMKNTHFVNACGLDADGHLSTPYDVAVMSRELMKHEAVYGYTTIWMDYLRGGETQLVNTNKMLHSYTGTTGLKTGTTSKAGVCIAATAKRQNMSLIAVVLGADSGQERFDAAKKLLDFGFSNFESRPFPQIEDCPQEIKVKFGVQKTAQLTYNLPQTLLFLKGSAAQLESRITLPESVEAPMSKGSKIGSVGLYSGGQKIKEYTVELAQDLERVTFAKALEILVKTAAQM